MKLKEARVTLFRNFVDSDGTPIDDSVTCLVGKNESGKTAFLEALYSINPAHKGQVRVDVTMDYPRWRKVRDERRSNLAEVSPIEAVFTLDAHDLAELHEISKGLIPSGTELVVSRSYDDRLRLRLVVPEHDLLEELCESGSLMDDLQFDAGDFNTVDDLITHLVNEIKGKDKRTKRARSLVEFKELVELSKKLMTGPRPQELLDKLAELIPTFFYFSEYSNLAGRIDLTDLLNKPEKDMEDHERTAMALLHLVGVKGPEFMETDFEVRIAELEAAANEVTRQVFEYWTSNQDLIVDLEGDAETVNRPDGQAVVHRFVDIRLNDLRHQMTTNFETRSTGFQWFFSFIVAFSEYEENPNVIILLDEPGLGLHARAQSDLLKFIEERLSSHSQVLYTSHSPFTVNPKHLERVRLVEDLSSRENPDIGAKISTDVLSVRRDTLFPLQAALGYDMAQNLFHGGFNLVIEGPSELIYLSLMSEHLEGLSKGFLDPRFTLIPVGGADKIPTFVALLGAHLDVTVLVDAHPSQYQKLQDMIGKGLLSDQKLVGVSQVTSVASANIEDLFSPQEYLNLYNEAFGENVKTSDLIGNDSIIGKIERHIGREFNHLKPATTFLLNRDANINLLSDETIERFEKLFNLVNATLNS